ncbi:hypothetical protein QFC21_001107 [Naganishia friedmannii]|uniref:Uncharacterized protein n=1 Tax=Naganishia friedmannii TaxID=89922 RepID=A0ACC2W7N3_9TREE|nr:hypothetical protein QFC21_001107 [Naganishia friedmannii]
MTTTTATSSGPKESVLIVYVHGFKGTDVTFEQFPERLQHVVYESRRAAGLDSVVVSKVFPVFETKGELKVATDTFLEWLTNETVHLETATRSRAKVVLCGHSMGGLLIADAAIAIAHDGGKPGSTAPGKEEENEKWPRIVALIAFDTPYLGLNPAVFKNGITKYAGHVEFAKNVVGGLGGLGLGGGAVWGMFGGAGTGGQTETQREDEKATEGNEKTTKARTTRNSSAVAANNVQATRPSKTPPPPPPAPAATPRWPLTTIPSLKTLATAASAAAILTTTAAAAYYKRDDLVGGWTWVTDHAVWLKNLWDSRGMRDRLSGIQEMTDYYTLIPASPPSHPTERSFCLLPATTHPLHSSWRATTFSAKTEDEVGAHIGMFNAAANEGFYNLGLDVARAVEEALERDLDVEREKEEEEEADFLVG